MTYKEFIQNIIDTRGQWNIPDGEYWEGHHILPRCLGGSGKPKQIHENIIWLYPQEHFIAHKLLAIENPTNYSIVTAFRLMCITTRRSSKFIAKTRIEITPDDYALCRKLFNECPMPESVRKKISDKATGKPHPKPNKENYGKWRSGRHVYINLQTNSKIFIADNENVPDGYISQVELTKAKKLEEKLAKPPVERRRRTDAEKLAVSNTIKNKELHWFTNSVDEVRCKKENCPEGWYSGRSEIKKQQIKENHKHTSNSGEKNGMYNKHHTEETKQKIGNFGKGKHWFNNDIVEVFELICPVGFKPGRLQKSKRRQDTNE